MLKPGFRIPDSPVVMGILNVTPDSFSDGGRFTTVERALQQARQMIAEGAMIIDIGGESTRPGAMGVSTDEELQRVIPIIEAIRAESEITLSIDTSKAEVMAAAVGAGANLINDVRALRDDNALATAAALNVPVCLMHMQGEPRSMQDAPRYQDVVGDVMAFLRQRVESCLAAGMAAEQIILDPGFGFGKTLEQNLVLFKHLDRFTAMGHPLLVGVSRKSMIAGVLDVPVKARLSAGLALAGLAVWLGARIIRAHDVQQTVHAVKMCHAVRQAGEDKEKKQ